MREVWPGIDVRIGPRSPGDRAHIPGPGWKEDWILQPGANLSDLVIRHDGVELELADDGSLSIQLGETAEVRWGAPYAYQTKDTKVVKVESSYVLDGNTVRFALGEYDPAFPVVIDPDIVFATYIGATQPNWGFTAAYDDDGRALGGTALWSSDLSTIGTYPTTAGAMVHGDDGGDLPVRLRLVGVQSRRHRPGVQHCVWGWQPRRPFEHRDRQSGRHLRPGHHGVGQFLVTEGAYNPNYCNNGALNLDDCCFYPSGPAPGGFQVGRACL